MRNGEGQRSARPQRPSDQRHEHIRRCESHGAEDGVTDVVRVARRLQELNRVVGDERDPRQVPVARARPFDLPLRDVYTDPSGAMDSYEVSEVMARATPQLENMRTREVSQDLGAWPASGSGVQYMRGGAAAGAAGSTA